MMANALQLQCLQIKLKNCLKILQKYDWLLNAFVLDFYVQQHWRKLSKCWQQQLHAVPCSQLCQLLTNDTANLQQQQTVLPLELLALKQVLQQLCISRVPASQFAQPASSLLLHAKLKHIFCKGVKRKKRHEVQQMAVVCQRSCQQTKVDFVIDFGAGLGHLARVLAYNYGIRVCCLEMQAQLNEQAKLIDLQLEVLAAKYLNSAQTAHFQRPTHVTLKLSHQLKPDEFLCIIKNALALKTDNFTFGIIGLHSCGDLASILMRLFLNCTQAKFLNFVSCCYMKLSQTHTTTAGYPLSRFLNLQQNAQLSYESLEISCHALETYADRLLQNNYAHLKVHSYRAAAERILVKHWPHLRHSGLSSVKHVQHIPFEQYFYKAVQHIPVALKLPLQHLQNAQTHADLEDWQQVVVFYTLRLLLAPLVESIILYDRLLFLAENDCQVDIGAIFDPRLSPRNHIISAFKKS